MRLPVFRLFLILALCALTSCAPTRDLSQAPQGSQSIVIWHRASGERIHVTTRSNGQYNKEAFSEIDHIFRDRHTGEEYPIDPKLIDAIAELRDKLMMSPSDPIELLSGYRSPESNAKLATINKYVAKNSYHMKGQAADIRIPDMSSSALEAVAKTIQKGGVAIYPDGGPDFGHVHVDTGPVRGWIPAKGREPGFAEARKASKSSRSSTSSSSATRFQKEPAPVKGRQPISSGVGTSVRIRPINSYDNLPEPGAGSGAPPPRKAVEPDVQSQELPAPEVKTKSGATVKAPAKIAPKTAPTTHLHTPSFKKPSLEEARKQWVKPAYRPSAKPASKTPAKPASKATPAKKPAAKSSHSPVAKPVKPKQDE